MSAATPTCTIDIDLNYTPKHIITPLDSVSFAIPILTDDKKTKSRAKLADRQDHQINLHLLPSNSRTNPLISRIVDKINKQTQLEVEQFHSTFEHSQKSQQNGKNEQIIQKNGKPTPILELTTHYNSQNTLSYKWRYYQSQKWTHFSSPSRLVHYHFPYIRFPTQHILYTADKRTNTILLKNNPLPIYFLQKIDEFSQDLYHLSSLLSLKHQLHCWNSSLYIDIMQSYTSTYSRSDMSKLCEIIVKNVGIIWKKVENDIQIVFQNMFEKFSTISTLLSLVENIPDTFLTLNGIDPDLDPYSKREFNRCVDSTRVNPVNNDVDNGQNNPTELSQSEQSEQNKSTQPKTTHDKTEPKTTQNDDDSQEYLFQQFFFIQQQYSTSIFGSLFSHDAFSLSHFPPESDRGLDCSLGILSRGFFEQKFSNIKSNNDQIQQTENDKQKKDELRDNESDGGDSNKAITMEERLNQSILFNHKFRYLETNSHHFSPNTIKYRYNVEQYFKLVQKFEKFESTDHQKGSFSSGGSFVNLFSGLFGTTTKDKSEIDNNEDYDGDDFLVTVYETDLYQNVILNSNELKTKKEKIDQTGRGQQNRPKIDTNQTYISPCLDIPTLHSSRNFLQLPTTNTHLPPTHPEPISLHAYFPLHLVPAKFNFENFENMRDRDWWEFSPENFEYLAKLIHNFKFQKRHNVGKLWLGLLYTLHHALTTVISWLTSSSILNHPNNPLDCIEIIRQHFRQNDPNFDPNCDPNLAKDLNPVEKDDDSEFFGDFCTCSWNNHAMLNVFINLQSTLLCRLEFTLLLNPTSSLYSYQHPLLTTPERRKMYENVKIFKNVSPVIIPSFLNTILQSYTQLKSLIEYYTFTITNYSYDPILYQNSPRDNNNNDTAATSTKTNSDMIEQFSRFYWCEAIHERLEDDNEVDSPINETVTNLTKTKTRMSTISQLVLVTNNSLCQTLFNKICSIILLLQPSISILLSVPVLSKLSSVDIFSDYLDFTLGESDADEFISSIDYGIRNSEHNLKIHQGLANFFDFSIPKMNLWDLLQIKSNLINVFVNPSMVMKYLPPIDPSRGTSNHHSTHLPFISPQTKLSTHFLHPYPTSLEESFFSEHHLLQLNESNYKFHHFWQNNYSKPSQNDSPNPTINMNDWKPHDVSAQFANGFALPDTTPKNILSFSHRLLKLFYRHSSETNLTFFPDHSGQNFNYENFRSDFPQYSQFLLSNFSRCYPKLPLPKIDSFRPKSHYHYIPQGQLLQRVMTLYPFTFSTRIGSDSIRHSYLQTVLSRFISEQKRARFWNNTVQNSPIPFIPDATLYSFVLMNQPQQEAFIDSGNLGRFGQNYEKSDQNESTHNLNPQYTRILYALYVVQTWRQASLQRDAFIHSHLNSPASHLVNLKRIKINKNVPSGGDFQTSNQISQARLLNLKDPIITQNSSSYHSYPHLTTNYPTSSLYIPDTFLPYKETYIFEQELKEPCYQTLQFYQEENEFNNEANTSNGSNLQNIFFNLNKISKRTHFLLPGIHHPNIPYNPSILTISEFRRFLHPLCTAILDIITYSMLVVQSLDKVCFFDLLPQNHNKQSNTTPSQKYPKFSIQLICDSLNTIYRELALGLGEFLPTEGNLQDDQNEPTIDPERRSSMQSLSKTRNKVATRSLSNGFRVEGVTIEDLPLIRPTLSHLINNIAIYYHVLPFMSNIILKSGGGSGDGDSDGDGGGSRSNSTHGNAQNCETCPNDIIVDSFRALLISLVDILRMHPYVANTQSDMDIGTFHTAFMNQIEIIFYDLANLNSLMRKSGPLIPQTHSQQIDQVHRFKQIVNSLSDSTQRWFYNSTDINAEKPNYILLDSIWDYFPPQIDQNFKDIKTPKSNQQHFPTLDIFSQHNLSNQLLNDKFTLINHFGSPDNSLHLIDSYFRNTTMAYQLTTISLQIFSFVWDIFNKSQTDQTDNKNHIQNASKNSSTIIQQVDLLSHDFHQTRIKLSRLPLPISQLILQLRDGSQIEDKNIQYNDDEVNPTQSALPAPSSFFSLDYLLSPFLSPNPPQLDPKSYLQNRPFSLFPSQPETEAISLFELIDFSTVHYHQLLKHLPPSLINSTSLFDPSDSFFSSSPLHLTTKSYPLMQQQGTYPDQQYSTLTPYSSTPNGLLRVIFTLLYNNFINAITLNKLSVPLPTPPSPSPPLHHLTPCLKNPNQHTFNHFVKEISLPPSLIPAFSIFNQIFTEQNSNCQNDDFFEICTISIENFITSNLAFVQHDRNQIINCLNNIICSLHTYQCQTTSTFSTVNVTEKILIFIQKLLNAEDQLAFEKENQSLEEKKILEQENAQTDFQNSLNPLPINTSPTPNLVSNSTLIQSRVVNSTLMGDQTNIGKTAGDVGLENNTSPINPVNPVQNPNIDQKSQLKSSNGEVSDDSLPNNDTLKVTGSNQEFMVNFINHIKQLLDFIKQGEKINKNDGPDLFRKKRLLQSKQQEQSFEGLSLPVEGHTTLHYNTLTNPLLQFKPFQSGPEHQDLSVLLTTNIDTINASMASHINSNFPFLVEMWTTLYESYILHVGRGYYADCKNQIKIQTFFEFLHNLRLNYSLDEFALATLQSTIGSSQVQSILLLTLKAIDKVDFEIHTLDENNNVNSQFDNSHPLYDNFISHEALNHRPIMTPLQIINYSFLSLYENTKEKSILIDKDQKSPPLPQNHPTQNNLTPTINFPFSFTPIFSYQLMSYSHLHYHPLNLLSSSATFQEALPIFEQAPLPTDPLFSSMPHPPLFAPPLLSVPSLEPLGSSPVVSPVISPRPFSPTPPDMTSPSVAQPQRRLRRNSHSQFLASQDPNSSKLTPPGFSSVYYIPSEILTQTTMFPQTVSMLTYPINKTIASHDRGINYTFTENTYKTPPITPPNLSPPSKPYLHREYSRTIPELVLNPKDSQNRLFSNNPLPPPPLLPSSSSPSSSPSLSPSLSPLISSNAGPQPISVKWPEDATAPHSFPPDVIANTFLGTHKNRTLAPTPEILLSHTPYTPTFRSEQVKTLVFSPKNLPIGSRNYPPVQSPSPTLVPILPENTLRIQRLLTMYNTTAVSSKTGIQEEICDPNVFILTELIPVRESFDGSYDEQVNRDDGGVFFVGGVFIPLHRSDPFTTMTITPAKVINTKRLISPDPLTTSPSLRQTRPLSHADVVKMLNNLHFSSQYNNFYCQNFSKKDKNAPKNLSVPNQIALNITTSPFPAHIRYLYHGLTSQYSGQPPLLPSIIFLRIMIDPSASNLMDLFIRIAQCEYQKSLGTRDGARLKTPRSLLQIVQTYFQNFQLGVRFPAVLSHVVPNLSKTRQLVLKRDNFSLFFGFFQSKIAFSNCMRVMTSLSYLLPWIYAGIGINETHLQSRRSDILKRFNHHLDNFSHNFEQFEHYLEHNFLQSAPTPNQNQTSLQTFELSLLLKYFITLITAPGQDNITLSKVITSLYIIIPRINNLIQRKEIIFNFIFLEEIFSFLFFHHSPDIRMQFHVLILFYCIRVPNPQFLSISPDTTGRDDLDLVLYQGYYNENITEKKVSNYFENVPWNQNGSNNSPNHSRNSATTNFQLNISHQYPRNPTSEETFIDLKSAYRVVIRKNEAFYKGLIDKYNEKNDTNETAKHRTKTILNKTSDDILSDNRLFCGCLRSDRNPSRDLLSQRHLCGFKPQRDNRTQDQKCKHLLSKVETITPSQINMQLVDNSFKPAEIVMASQHIENKKIQIDSTELLKLQKPISQASFPELPKLPKLPPSKALQTLSDHTIIVQPLYTRHDLGSIVDDSRHGENREHVEALPAQNAEKNNSNENKNDNQKAQNEKDETLKEEPIDESLVQRKIIDPSESAFFFRAIEWLGMVSSPRYGNDQNGEDSKTNSQNDQNDLRNNTDENNHHNNTNPFDHETDISIDEVGSYDSSELLASMGIQQEMIMFDTFLDNLQTGFEQKQTFQNEEQNGVHFKETQPFSNELESLSSNDELSPLRQPLPPPPTLPDPIITITPPTQPASKLNPSFILKNQPNPQNSPNFSQPLPNLVNFPHKFPFFADITLGLPLPPPNQSNATPKQKTKLFFSLTFEDILFDTVVRYHLITIINNYLFLYYLPYLFPQSFETVKTNGNGGEGNKKPDRFDLKTPQLDIYQLPASYNKHLLNYHNNSSSFPISTFVLLLSELNAAAQKINMSTNPQYNTANFSSNTHEKKYNIIPPFPNMPQLHHLDRLESALETFSSALVTYQSYNTTQQAKHGNFDSQITQNPKFVSNMPHQSNITPLKYSEPCFDLENALGQFNKLFTVCSDSFSRLFSTECMDFYKTPSINNGGGIGPSSNNNTQQKTDHTHDNTSNVELSSGNSDLDPNYQLNLKIVDQFEQTFKGIGILLWKFIFSTTLKMDSFPFLILSNKNLLSIDPSQLPSQQTDISRIKSITKGLMELLSQQNMNIPNGLLQILKNKNCPHQHNQNQINPTLNKPPNNLPQLSHPTMSPTNNLQQSLSLFNKQSWCLFNSLPIELNVQPGSSEYIRQFESENNIDQNGRGNNSQPNKANKTKAIHTFTNLIFPIPIMTPDFYLALNAMKEVNSYHAKIDKLNHDNNSLPNKNSEIGREKMSPTQLDPNQAQKSDNIPHKSHLKLRPKFPIYEYSVSNSCTSPNQSVCSDVDHVAPVIALNIEKRSKLAGERIDLQAIDLMDKFEKFDLSIKLQKASINSNNSKVEKTLPDISEDNVEKRPEMSLPRIRSQSLSDISKTDPSDENLVENTEGIPRKSHIDQLLALSSKKRPLSTSDDTFPPVSSPPSLVSPRQRRQLRENPRSQQIRQQLSERTSPSSTPNIALSPSTFPLSLPLSPFVAHSPRPTSHSLSILTPACPAWVPSSASLSLRANSVETDSVDIEKEMLSKYSDFGEKDYVIDKNKSDDPNVQNSSNNNNNNNNNNKEVDSQSTQPSLRSISSTSVSIPIGLKKLQREALKFKKYKASILLKNSDPNTSVFSGISGQIKLKKIKPEKPVHIALTTGHITPRPEIFSQTIPSMDNDFDIIPNEVGKNNNTHSPKNNPGSNQTKISSNHNVNFCTQCDRVIQLVPTVTFVINAPELYTNPEIK